MAELRRLLPALHEAEEQREQRLWWSRFRRRHQAIAQRCHVIRRARQAPPARPPGPPLRVPSLPELTPAHWAQISPLLPRSRLGRPAGDHQLMLEGILWVMRTGGSWRALPERFGPWSTVAGCYHRWRHGGIWERIWERIRQVLLTPAVPFFSSA